MHPLIAKKRLMELPARKMEGKTNKTNNKTKHKQYQKEAKNNKTKHKQYQKEGEKNNKTKQTTKQNINNSKNKEKIRFKIEIPELTFINRYQLVCARRVSGITLIRFLD
jgi:ribosomal protein S25